MSKFDIATEMNGIMASPVYQSVFAKPELQFNKTAAKKVDEKEKAKAEAAKEKEKAAKEKEKAAKEKAKAKEKAEKEKAKAKAEKEKAKAKKKAMTKYEECIYSLCKASEILDQAGLNKASALTLLALDNLVKTAAKKKDDSKGKKEDKKEEKKDDKKDKKLPPFMKKKEDKKEDKKDKKVKKAAEEIGECGDMSMAADSDDNKDFEDLMRELDEGGDEGDWEVLNQPAEAKGELEDIDPDDPEITSLVESIDEPKADDEIDLSMLASEKKSSLQKLAAELGVNFLA